MNVVTTFFALTLLPLAAAGADYLVDGCRDSRNWVFINGAEFPGAVGGVVDDADGVRLRYDFLKGGAYVAVRPGNFNLPDAEAYTLTVRPERELKLKYRLTDANGRVFQSPAITVKAGEDQPLAFTPAGPWESAWGGRDGVTAFTAPVREFWLLVDKPGAESGSLLLRDFTATVAGDSALTLTGPGFQQNAAGWQLTGAWRPQLDGALLEVTANPVKGAEVAELSFVQPRDGRDAVRRYTLNPAAGKRTLFYRPELPFGVNPRNRYQVAVELKSADGVTIRIPAPASGALASQINLGELRNSTEIPASRLGTCVHFSYAPTPEGPFSGWYQRERLLDEIAACGLKYIRESIAIEKDEAGNYRVRPRDIETLKMARERGIEQIVIIDMNADEPIPELLKRLDAAVRDTDGLVRVFELGNEPNNFGNWRQKYRQPNGREGNWNGYEAGTKSVSEWVKAVVRATNAAADHLKKIKPDAIAIGLGAPSPTNFHALNQGVTPNLDGVTDHPYNYCMVPEKIPFGGNLLNRDGIEVSDAENTFAGLIDSYLRHFRKTGGERSIWLTEFGFTSFWFDGKNEGGLFAGFSEEAQAAYLVRRFVEGLALPIAASCQYDFLDDYNSAEHDGEANFGLLRGDFSRKPSFYAVGRVASLLSGAEPDPAAKVSTTEKLHRGMVRGELVHDWDAQKITAANGVRVLPFFDAAHPEERMLALWSLLPYSGEYSNRSVSLEIDGWGEFRKPPVGINLMTGETFDLPLEVRDGKLVIPQLALKEHPVLLKFFR